MLLARGGYLWTVQKHRYVIIMEVIDDQLSKTVIMSGYSVSNLCIKKAQTFSKAYNDEQSLTLKSSGLKFKANMSGTRETADWI